MNWLDALKALVADVANQKAGQVGGLLVSAPDDRSKVVLACGGWPDRSTISVMAEGKTQVFPPDKASEAVDAYVAAVEGYA